MEFEENNNLMILDPSGIDISGTGKLIIDSSGDILTTGDICANDLSVNSIVIKGIAFPDPNTANDGQILKMNRGNLLWEDDNNNNDIEIKNKTSLSITVSSKTNQHPYYNSGSSNGYYIEGIESPIIYFKPGNTYRFKQNDNTNFSHPIKFYNDINKISEFTTGVVTNGIAGNENSYVEILVTETTPTKLYYQCGNHGFMGNYCVIEISIESVNIQQLSYLKNIDENIKNKFDLKQDIITGAATTIATEDITVSKALISNDSGKVAVSNISTTELSYLSGVTSNIQDQLTNAASSSGGSNVKANYGNAGGDPLTKIEINGVSHPISGGGGSSQWINGSSNAIYYNSGNVGIGTDAPTSRLDVSGGLNVTNGAIITNSIRLSGNNLGTTNNSLRWDSSGNRIFYNTDNVGIGTTNPSEKLDVNGTIKASNIKIGSSDVATQSFVNTQLLTKQNNINYNPPSDNNSNPSTSAQIKSALDNKQDTIVDGDLTIANTSGLQTALDLKAPINTPTFTGTPYAPTPPTTTNSTQIATTAYVKSLIGEVIDGAPETLDTLNELATALNEKAVATNVATSLSEKVTKTGNESISGNKTFTGDSSFNNINFTGTFTQNGNPFTSGVTEINGLTDVDTNTTAPTDGQALVWDDTNTVWKPGNVASGGGGSSTVNTAGQSFFEVLTQQPNKFKANHDISKNSVYGTDGNYVDTINLYWTYDDIIPKHGSTLAKLGSDNTEKGKMLPYIEEVKIDVSGIKTDNSLTGWSSSGINSFYSHFNSSIQDNESYNSSDNNYKYKKVTITKAANAGSTDFQNIISQTEVPFDIRVYGINHSEDTPNVETRSLIWSGLSFAQPRPPDSITFVAEDFTSYDTLTITMKCDTVGEVNSVITEYSQNETLASETIIVDTSDSDPETENNVASNSNFNSVLTGLRAGTKYNYRSKTRNTLFNPSSTTGYSDFLQSAVSDYTNIPISSTDDTVNLSISNSSKISVKTKGGINGNNVIYINKSGIQTLIPNTGTQTFEITNRNSTKSSPNGFGKYVDGSNDLVNVVVSVKENGGSFVEKDKIVYNGFNGENTQAVTTPTTGDFINTTSSQADQYSDTPRKSFRLNGTLVLKTITNNNIDTLVSGSVTNNESGDTYHEIKYDYNRHTDMGGSNQSETHKIYIDDLPNSPSIANTSESITVDNVVWSFGIPSVKTMTVAINRELTDINSVNCFIPGSGIISNIASIGNTNYYGNTKNISTGSIVANGEYTHTDTQNNIYYTSSRTGSNNPLSITGSATNLKDQTNFTPVTVPSTEKHWFDKNSFHGSGTGLYHKINLNSYNIYEITNSTELAKLNSNLGGIGITRYTDHSVTPKEHTLLYIDGKFKTNSSIAYPDTTNFDWLPTGESATYNSGTATTTPANYKWIVFKFNKNNDISTKNIAGANFYYINLYSKLQSYFDISIINKLRVKTDIDVIGFIRHEVSGTNKIGGFHFFDGTNRYDAGNKTSAITFTSILAGEANDIGYGSMLNPEYGSMFTQTDWGPYINTDDGVDDIYLFVGCK